MITANSRRTHSVDTHRSTMTYSGCQITPTRRTLWLRIRRACAIAWLRWEIDSAETWIEQCAREGIHDGKGLRELRRHVAALRVRMALWSKA